MTESQGKAVSLKLASALNQLCGSPPMPHLWNVVSAAGDRRYRLRERQGDSRTKFETDLLGAKYVGLPVPAAGVLCDAGPELDRFALPFLERLLSSGALQIRVLPAPHCRACGHMSGIAASACGQCGGTDLRDAQRRLLVAPAAAGGEALALADIHAQHTRHADHLRAIAGNVPETLIMSRTRDHGIGLDAIGLPDLVLDPRAGLHVAAWHAAAAVDPDLMVMVTTANALANVAAYGRPLRQYHEARVRYAVHGRISFGHLPPGPLIPAVATSEPAFADWFLPLCALKDKAGIPGDQLAALARFFHRAGRAAPRIHSQEQAELIRAAVKRGDTGWIRDRSQLPIAIAMAFLDADGSTGLPWPISRYYGPNWISGTS